MQRPSNPQALSLTSSEEQPLRNTKDIFGEMMIDSWHEWRTKRLPVLHNYDHYKSARSRHVKYEYTACHKSHEVVLPNFFLPAEQRTFAPPITSPPPPTPIEKIWHRAYPFFYQKGATRVMQALTIFSFLNTVIRFGLGAASVTGPAFYAPLAMLGVGLLYAIPPALMLLHQRVRDNLAKKLRAVEDDLNANDRELFTKIDITLLRLPFIYKFLLFQLPGNIDLKWKYFYLRALFYQTIGDFYYPQKFYKLAFPFCSTPQQQFIVLKGWITAIHQYSGYIERKGGDRSEVEKDLGFCLSQLPEAPYQARYDEYLRAFSEASDYFYRYKMGMALAAFDRIKPNEFDFYHYPNISIAYAQLKAILSLCSQVYPELREPEHVENKFYDAYDAFVNVDLLLRNSYPDLVEWHREMGRTFCRTAINMSMLIDAKRYDWSAEALFYHKSEKASRRCAKFWQGIASGNGAGARPPRDGSSDEETECDQSVRVEEIADDEPNEEQSIEMSQSEVAGERSCKEYCRSH